MKSTISQRPENIRVLYYLLALAALYTLYFAKSLLIPLVLALLVALLLSPIVTYLQRLKIPRTVSTLVLLAVSLGAMTLLASELVEPARKWAQAVPQISEALTEQLNSISDTLTDSTGEDGSADAEQQARENRTLFANLFGGDDPEAIAEITNGEGALITRLRQAGTEAVVYILGATPFAVIQILMILILILFLVIFGPNLFETYIRKSPNTNEETLTLVANIRSEVSRYILTISVINFFLGLCTAGLLYLLGIEDALLWGVLAGLLNFAPYLGSLISTTILCIAGLVQFGLDWYALMPALAFFVVNSTEAQFITPLLLGQNMRLNPLALVIWLLIWGWLWGAAGVLLAVPLLVCCKLVARQLGIFPGWVALVESRP